MPEEIQELREHAEEGARDPGMKPVTLTMAVLAVLVAMVSLAGHRAHTEVLLLQNKATDQWAYYQAKNMRRQGIEIFLAQMSIFNVSDAAQAKKMKEKYAKDMERYADELKETQAEARSLEAEVALAQRRANRFDLGEVLLESALVITSITLLTRRRAFWHAGLLFGGAGMAIAVTGLLLR